MLHQQLLAFNANNLPTPLKPVLSETSIRYPALVFSAHEINAIYYLPGSKSFSHNEPKTFRYLITLEGEHRFALEGRPSNVIAAHEAMPRKMGDACLYACNITTNSNNEIININNKSSNYQTPQSRLPYVIMALRCLTLNHPGFKLAESVTIEIFHRDINRQITEELLSRDAFIQLADEMMAVCKNKPEYYDEHKQFLFDYNETRVQKLKEKYAPFVYNDTPRHTRAHNDTFRKKSLFFTSAEDTSLENKIENPNTSHSMMTQTALPECFNQLLKNINARIAASSSPSPQPPLSRSLASPTTPPRSLFHNTPDKIMNPLKRHSVPTSHIPSDTESDTHSETSSNDGPVMIHNDEPLHKKMKAQ